MSCVEEGKRRRRQNRKRWYRLDNAAKIYPATNRRGWSSIFKVSVLLRETVNPDKLQQAFAETMERFPSMKVKMKVGLFWYYLDYNPLPVPAIRQDVVNPKIHVKWRENNGYLLKVYYYEKRVTLEVFHAVTDGFGAITFLKTMVAQYLRLCGIAIPAEEGILDIEKKASVREYEDAFKKYADSRTKMGGMEPKAYHFKGTPEPINTFHIITGILPLDKLLQTTRTLGVSITEYLTACLIEAHYEQQKAENRRRGRPVRVSVPVNMRTFYKTKTMRNFSLFINPGIDPAMGEYTFPEILKQVHHFMHYYINEKYLNAVMTRNVQSERNLLIRMTPLFLKNWILSLAFQFLGDAQFSSTLSNLGPVKVPPAMAECIDRFEFTLGPAIGKWPQCAVVSFQNKVVINFSSAVKETDIERRFFTKLVQNSIPVKIESNRQ